MVNNVGYKENVIDEFRSFKFILCRIQANITTKMLKLAKFMGFKLVRWQILANLGMRRLTLAIFGVLAGS